MRKEVLVLVVDDEPDIAALLVALLESEGHRTARAATGREALVMAARAKPAVVVLDLSLPDLDGLEVLRRLKARAGTAIIPVVVVSACTYRLSTSDRSLAHAVFDKPFDLDSLAATVNALALKRPVAPVRLRPQPAPG